MINVNAIYYGLKSILVTKLPAILREKHVLKASADVESPKHVKVEQLECIAMLQMVYVNALNLWMLVVLKKRAMEPYACAEPVNHVMVK